MTERSAEGSSGRKRAGWLAGGPLLLVAKIRLTTDTLQSHTTDTHYKHTLQTHTTDTHYRHT